MHNFPRYSYNVEQLNTHNTLCIHTSEIPNISKNEEYYICKIHKLQITPVCSACISFLSLETSFIICNDEAAFTIPPPMIFAKNNYSYYRNFLESFIKYAGNYTHTLKAYNTFIQNTSFRGGFLAKQLSGKTSYFKSYCLGEFLWIFKLILLYNTPLGGSGNCIRGTLIVCPQLMPGEVSIPKTIYDKLNEVHEFVMLNRDPSINTR